MKLALGFALAVSLVLVEGRAARADATADIQAALRAHLKTFGDDSIAGMAATGKVYLDAKATDAAEAGNFGVELTDNFSGSASIKLADVTIVVDDTGHTAWFHASGTLKYKEVVGEGIDGWAKPKALRLTGVMVDDGGWKVASIAYTTTMLDKDLVEGAGYDDPPLRPASGAPTHAGVDAIAKAADGWFTGGAGFVAGASASAKLVANGTAPTELGANRPASLKLAKAWDRLALGATAITATAYGKIGFVRATVRMPVKPPNATGKGPYAAEMTLYAIVVDEGGAWKWQALAWTARTNGN